MASLFTKAKESLAADREQGLGDAGRHRFICFSS